MQTTSKNFKVSGRGLDPLLLEVFASVDKLLDNPAFTSLMTVKCDHEKVLSVFKQKNITVFVVKPAQFNREHAPFFSTLHDWEMDDSAGFFDHRIDDQAIFINQEYFQGDLGNAQRMFAWVTLVHETNHLLHFHLKIPSPVTALPPPLNTAEFGSAWEHQNLGGLMWFGFEERDRKTPVALFLQMVSEDGAAIVERYIRPDEVTKFCDITMDPAQWINGGHLPVQLRLFPANHATNGVRKWSAYHKCCQALDVAPSTPPSVPAFKLIMSQPVRDRRPPR
ncbi:hypothetical protein BDZ88DRAFT_416567, partial [Geranomyces variabilis]